MLPAQKTTKLNIFLSAVKELFIFSLVLYLVLFILETVFPGFVSNNFNLNWVLGIVLSLGIISAFAPEEPKKKEKKEKPKIIDYLTSIFLGLLGGVLIFYKIELEPIPRLAAAGISGILILFLSLMLLLAEDEEIKEKEEEIETFVQGTFLSRKTFVTPIAFFRLLLFKKINFPVLLILIVFLFTTLSLPQKAGYAPRKLNLEKLASFFKSAPKEAVKLPPAPAYSPTPPQTIQELRKEATPSAEIMIKVLNGGAEKNEASDFAKILRNAGFAKVFFGEADSYIYTNATMKFRAEDEDQARLIKKYLDKNYPIVIGTPSATQSAEITVILGAKEVE